MDSNRLRLRRYTAADLPHLVALDNDPTVMRFINGGVPVPSEAYQRNLLPNFTAAVQDPFGFWVCETLARAWVGWFSLRPAEDGAAEIGYRLAQSAWGQGYATEGCRMLIQSAFQAGCAAVIAKTYEHNAASRRVLQKLAFREVQRFRWTPEMASDTAVSYGSVWDGDDLVYELKEGDWQGC